MIASLGGDARLLVFSATPYHTKYIGNVKGLTSLFQKFEKVVPGVMI